MEPQRIFDKHEAKIKEFISDLQMFATGSYLSEDEGENWMEPFDSNRIPAVEDVLMGFLKDAIANPSDPASAASDVAALYQRLNKINEEDLDPVVELEEFEDIEGILRSFYKDMGMAQEEVSAIPTYEEWAESREDEA